MWKLVIFSMRISLHEVDYMYISLTLIHANPSLWSTCEHGKIFDANKFTRLFLSHTLIHAHAKSWTNRYNIMNKPILHRQKVSLAIGGIVNWQQYILIVSFNN
jgi:hypothetical protein